MLASLMRTKFADVSSIVSSLHTRSLSSEVRLFYLCEVLRRGKVALGSFDYMHGRLNVFHGR